MMAVCAVRMMAVCAVRMMTATGAKTGIFDTVEARIIFVMNDAGRVAVVLGADDGGDGFVATQSAQGKDLVMLNSTFSGGVVSA